MFEKTLFKPVMYHGMKSIETNFQINRPMNKIPQTTFVFNGNLDGKMAQFIISCRKMT